MHSSVRCTTLPTTESSKLWVVLGAWLGGASGGGGVGYADAISRLPEARFVKLELRGDEAPVIVELAVSPRFF
jgi:hypothetical protein